MQGGPRARSSLGEIDAQAAFVTSPGPCAQLTYDPSGAALRRTRKKVFIIPFPYVVGAYVKQGAVVSTRYSQVNALRTIEDVLGTQHMNLNTAFQRPMTEVFDIGSSGKWSYQAEASTLLKTTGARAGAARPGRALREGPGRQAKARC